MICAAAAAQEATVLLVAPTGRAARRMAESTGLDASTVHAALGWVPGQGPTVDELLADVLIVDETSMANLELLVTLLRAVGPRTHVVLVGDADQLAPVGAGKPFAELVEAGAVPVTELTHIFRQAAGSMIVRGAHAVRQGGAPSFAAEEGLTRDLFLVERADPAQALEEVVSLVSERLPEHYGVDPVADIQVFAPVYRGALGIDVLNERLRAVLNPDGRPVLGGRLRTGRQADALGAQPARPRADERHGPAAARARPGRRDADGLRRGPRAGAARGGGAGAAARLRLLGAPRPGHRAAGGRADRPPGRGRVLPAARDALHRDDPGHEGDRGGRHPRGRRARGGDARHLAAPRPAGRAAVRLSG